MLPSFGTPYLLNHLARPRRLNIISLKLTLLLLKKFIRLEIRGKPSYMNFLDIATIFLQTNDSVISC